MRAIRSILRPTTARTAQPRLWWSGFQNWTRSRAPGWPVAARQAPLPGPTIWVRGPIVEFAYRREG